MSWLKLKDIENYKEVNKLTPCKIKLFFMQRLEILCAYERKHENGNNCKAIKNNYK